MLGFVDGLEDKRALRLVCKRSCAFVDSRVVAVMDGRACGYPIKKKQLPTLVRAPWQLQRLELGRRRLGDAGAAAGVEGMFCIR